MSVFTHVVAWIHAFFLPTAENVLYRPPSPTAWNRGEFHSQVHHLLQSCTHSRHQTQAQGLWAAVVPPGDTSLFLWLSLTELVKALHLLQLTETFLKKICLSLRAWVFSPYVCIYVMCVSGAFEGPSEGIRFPWDWSRDMGHHMGAGTRTWIFRKSHLSLPQSPILWYQMNVLQLNFYFVSVWFFETYYCFEALVRLELTSWLCPSKFGITDVCQTDWGL